VYVDSSRIEQKVGGYPIALWIRYDFGPPQHFMGPKHRFDRVDMHFGLDCSEERARISQLIAYDSTGAPHSTDASNPDIPGGTFNDGAYKGYAGMLRLTCAWLINPAAPPAIVDVPVRSE
jgi:hypothetical protein